MEEMELPGVDCRDANMQDVLLTAAVLRGADLRGARIEGVDFYLVDLRDAQFDAEQEDHFRRCRAILENPAA